MQLKIIHLRKLCKLMTFTSFGKSSVQSLWGSANVLASSKKDVDSFDFRHNIKIHKTRLLEILSNPTNQMTTSEHLRCFRFCVPCVVCHQMFSQHFKGAMSVAETWYYMALFSKRSYYLLLFAYYYYPPYKASHTISTLATSAKCD